MYKKIRFISTEHGATAGLVVDTNRDDMTITGLSRLYPMYEAPKMKRLQLSPEFPTWNEAFSHKFENEN